MKSITVYKIENIQTFKQWWFFRDNARKDVRKFLSRRLILNNYEISVYSLFDTPDTVITASDFFGGFKG